MTATTTTAETVHLTGWGEFEDLRESILARLFGELVKRAIPVVQEFHSDLFHDTRWLRENVTGSTTFDYLVRTSGTNIGDLSARVQVSIGAPGGVFYRVDLIERRGDWSARFTQIPLDKVERP